MENPLTMVCLLLFAILGSCSAASIDWQPCRSEYLRIAQESSLTHMLPRCDENGLYKPLQRTYSNFECHYPDGEPDNIYNYPGDGPCRKLKQCLKNHTTLPGVEDHKLIRCDKFGLFEPLQKEENGNLICSLLDGEFPQPYGVTAGKRDCKDSQPCAKVAQEHFKTSSGDMLVRCDKQGRFKPLQRFHKKLECFFPNGADFTSDYAVQGPCRQLRRCLRHKYHTTKGVKEHKMIRCDKFGYFKPLQKLDGRMICVDFHGNIRKSSGVKGNQDCLYAVIVN